MFINNKNITEELKITSAIDPATSTAKSASELVDMSVYGKFLTLVEQGAVTTAGNTVIKVYESTASTWNGAVATLVTASVTTTSVNTSSGAIISVELDASAFDKQYVGVYVTKADADSAIAAQHVRGAGRYGQ